MRVLIVEDNLQCALAIMEKVPEVEWVHLRTGLEGILTLTNYQIAWDALLLDMNLPGFVEHPWLEPLQWMPRFFKIEGDAVLRLAKLLKDPPKVIIAISGVPANNDQLIALGATHRVDGKIPAAIREILLMHYSPAISAPNGDIVQ